MQLVDDVLLGLLVVDLEVEPLGNKNGVVLRACRAFVRAKRKTTKEDRTSRKKKEENGEVYVSSSLGSREEVKPPLRGVRNDRVGRKTYLDIYTFLHSALPLSSGCDTTPQSNGIAPSGAGMPACLIVYLFYCHSTARILTTRASCAASCRCCYCLFY